jgi:hypothetical protein
MKVSELVYEISQFLFDFISEGLEPWQRSWYSIWLQAGKITDGSEYESWLGKEFSCLHFTQICYGAHPASYTMSRGSFPRGKVARA